VPSAELQRWRIEGPSSCPPSYRNGLTSSLISSACGLLHGPVALGGVGSCDGDDDCKSKQCKELNSESKARKVDLKSKKTAVIRQYLNSYLHEPEIDFSSRKLAFLQRTTAV
jgi:hypothetical protein